MINNNNKENSKEVENKKLKIGSDGRFIYDKLPEKEYKFIEVNFITGDQFIKTSFLRSKDGTGTVNAERVKKFYDEAEEEAREWRKNHPGESVTIRVLEGEDGEQKQIIEAVPKNDLICPSPFRRIYDPKTGEQIVGEENIRKEVNRREAQWRQFEREGKLEVVNHQIHHTDDGNTISVLSRVPPVKMLHENEINDETTWIPLGNKMLEGNVNVNESKKTSEGSQQTSENKISEGSSKEENIDENIQKENVQKVEENDKSIVEKIKKSINEWRVKKIDVTLSSGVKAKHDFLVHSSAKVNINELGTLIYPVEIFTDSERKELSEVLNDSLFVNFLSSGKIGRESLNRNNYQSISLANSSTPNNTQRVDKGKSVLIVFGVVFVLLVAGLVIVKSRFSKNKKK